MNFFATLLVVGVLLSVNSIKAQEGSNTGDVTLNIKLSPIQTLVVNAGQTTVNLEYKTKADYSGGVSANEANHLEIYSTGAFEIKAKASTSTLNNTNIGQGMDVNTVTIIPTAGTNSLADADYTTTSLSAEAQTIISSTTGGVANNFNIEYKGKGGDAYVNYYNNAENPTVYTTIVTYTIAAK